MPGIGPAPLDPQKRARGARGEVVREIAAESSPQPELPADREWPQQTHEFWRVWGESPLTTEFTAAEWAYMLDTAILHARLWNGDPKAAAELRLRLAKVGATAEDRARLRITFAQANSVEKQTTTSEKDVSDAYDGLKLVEDA